MWVVWIAQTKSIGDDIKNYYDTTAVAVPPNSTDKIYSFSDTILVTVFPFTISVNDDFTVDDDLIIL